VSATVAVIGEGHLPDLVCDRLGTGYRLLRQMDLRDGAPQRADLALVLHDGWSVSVQQKAEEVFRESGTPWLRGYVSFGEGIVGPLVRRGHPGCSQCADYRLVMAGRDRQENWMVRQQTINQGSVSRDIWASNTGLLQMACLISEEARRVLQGLQVLTENQLFIMNLITLNTSIHFVLPDPHCPVCGELPEDTASGALVTLGQSLKTSPESFRCRSMEQLEKVLALDYLDFRTGLLNGKMYDLQSPFADASVNLPMFAGDEGTAGRTHRYTDSLQTAILEGLERHCGLTPRGKKTVIRDSYRRVQAYALNPVDTGTHAPEQYAEPDFPFQSFDPEREINWVWGYSFLRESAVLVPEQLAYYSTACGQGFVYETSNGCALGGSLEEAVFYGIMEVVERDSFLLTWYARLPLPRIDPDSSGDPEMRQMIDRLEAAAGYDILLFNSTMEHGIPSIWSIAKNKTGKGVNLICAAGAHPDPVRAAKSSIHELAAMLLSQNDKFAENRRTYEQMLDEPSQVRQMEDHSMLYALPEAEERLRFLLDDSRPMRSFEQEYLRRDWNADLSDDLKEMIQSFRRLNMDVIVVDQTGPELRRNGLHCVKILIPGMLPMTFGFHLTRLTGLDRVLKVPAALGYAKQLLTYEQLNPHPHPFP
jgi:ribosomal protein S12 methylthiotransferase accessory factor